MRKYNGFASARILALALLGLAVAACGGKAPYADSSVKSLSGEAPSAAESDRAAPRTQAAPSAAARPDRDAAPVVTEVRAPYRYVVKKGDTLWGIAQHFLRDAWQWPEVWVVNPRVDNPHLIYPGDVLHLIYKDGRPRVTKAVAVSNVERMSPQVRENPLNEAIPAIPIDVIRNFLKGPRLMSRRELERAPYIVEFTSEHVISGSNTGVYAAKVPRGEAFVYSIVRLGEPYHDPESNTHIGYEAIQVGQAEVTRYGPEVTSLWVTESLREVRIGDRLVPVLADEFKANFFPHSPDGPVDGRIISVYDGVSQIGQYQIVTVNRGAIHGMEPGHVLAINQAGRSIRDPYEGGRLQLPDEYAGLLMLFKIHARLSYGLVMEAERAIHVLDKVERPEAD